MFYSAMTSDDVACGSQDAFFFFCDLAPGGIYRYVSPQRVCFFCAVYVFKRVSRLCSFGMKSGIFEEIYSAQVKQKNNSDSQIAVYNRTSTLFLPECISSVICVGEERAIIPVINRRQRVWLVPLKYYC